MANEPTNFGRNADLIKAVADLYVGKGATILDVTCGHGAVEDETDTSGSDLPGTTEDEQHDGPTSC